MSVGVGILAFLLAFGAGVVSKFAIQPGWAKEYSVKWSDEIGTLKEDLPYGDGEANKFDLYLPKTAANPITGWLSTSTQAALPPGTSPATGRCWHGSAPRVMWRQASTTRSARIRIPPAS